MQSNIQQQAVAYPRLSFFAKIFSEKHKKLAKGVPNGTPQPHTSYDKIYMQNVKTGVVYAKEK